MLLSKASIPQSAHEFCISYTGIFTQLEALEIFKLPTQEETGFASVTAQKKVDSAKQLK